MKEIEVRAVIANPSDISNHLRNLGFEFKGSWEQMDIILDRPDASLFRSGRKIRIRVENELAEFTYKGPFEGDTQASRRDEITIPIQNSDTNMWIKIFEALGFPVCFTVPKRRQLFIGRGVKVTLDDWPIIGYLMELEGDENTIKALLKDIAPPEVIFSNYRLKDLFRQKEIETGQSLKELQAEYEESHGCKLGRLELLLL
jgi:predicted adenylyl cyclase CyaB